MQGMRAGFALTGSFCTFAQVLPQVKALAEAGAQVQPILSYHVQVLDTRFYRADDLRQDLLKITGNVPWATLQEVEPIGPKKLLDLLVIAPCTGNTLAKLASGITDTPVTLAAKSQLRNGGPVLVAVSTNDGLAAAGKNIGLLLATRNLYFVPFRQDDPQGKPTSLVADFARLPDAAKAALAGRQVQPLLCG
ncbi:MAG: dipicolinate synthase subunit B [Oscillospiraceae bacterium]|nr:dipicolinate synthase subunit B [Oscillospiraceae bacterium]